MRTTPQLQDFTPLYSHGWRAVFADSVRLLWRRRLFIVAVTLSIAVLSALVSLLLKPQYESTTRLLPAPASSPSNEMWGMVRPEATALAGLVGVNAGVSEGRFVALLESRALADRIIDRFGLMKTYGARYRHEARSALADHTVISEDRKTAVITVTVTDSNPQRAAALAGAYVKELEQLNAEMNTSGAHLERVFLEKRVEEVTTQLHDSAERLSQFSSKYSVVDAPEQAKSTVGAALALQGQLVAAEAELKGLEEIYSPASVRVRAASARIAELRRNLDTLRGPQSVLDIPPDGSLPSIRNLPSIGVTYGELYRRAKLLEAVQLALTQQLEIAKTEEIKQLPVFRVMDPAEIPEQRVFPRRAAMVEASTFCGLLLAIGLVLAGDRWRRTSADDPIKCLVVEARQRIASGALIRRPAAWGDPNREPVALAVEEKK